MPGPGRRRGAQLLMCERGQARRPSSTYSERRRQTRRGRKGQPGRACRRVCAVIHRTAESMGRRGSGRASGRVLATSSRVEQNDQSASTPSRTASPSGSCLASCRAWLHDPCRPYLHPTPPSPAGASDVHGPDAHTRDAAARTRAKSATVRAGASTTSPPIPSAGSVAHATWRIGTWMELSTSVRLDRRGRSARIVTPIGELTALTMPVLRTWIGERLSEGARRIVVDMSQVTRLDDSARAGLVICARAARAAHARLVVSGTTS
jgi:anti-anti-sigma regulatory factor